MHRRLARLHRLLAVAALGFASGLPLALTGQAMQAWLTMDGLAIADIGFLTLVGLPYTFKFLWAPLMDRFDLSGRWRRRGWMVLTQLALAVALLALAATSPRESLRAFALLALTVAFLSASQDIVVDAYRTDVLLAAERGLGASLAVMGYRMAMIVSGGITLIWTDAAQGSGWSWSEVYRVMALLMVAAAVFSALFLPGVPALLAAPAGPGAGVARRSGRQDLLGFAALVAAVAVGVALTQVVGKPLAVAALAPLLNGSSLSPALRERWADLAALLAGIACTLPLATWAARRARFDTLLDGMHSYFSQRGALAFLAFIVLYKLGDAFAGSLMTPFLLTGLHYTAAEVGVVNKVIGLWLTIAGALAGGALMFRLGLWRALLLFGVLQAVSNLGFWWLAAGGKGAFGGLLLPALDWGFVAITAPTPVDGALLAAVACENLAGGMGTAGHVAFQMSLCQQRFSATQYALLSAFGAVGRVWVGPMAGVTAESIGWPAFFMLSTWLAAPALLILLWLRSAIEALDASPPSAVVD
ncbi:MAG: MFS transporter [Candidatus Accumulibacter sp.]|nr:MFS transporter [Accumulibacter sp.]MBO3717470.1 MFS transporter [Accumulibacter sp.]